MRVPFSALGAPCSRMISSSCERPHFEFSCILVEVLKIVETVFKCAFNGLVVFTERCLLIKRLCTQRIRIWRLFDLIVGVFECIEV
uniref:Secreted protein n=1 Tax=Parascaris univalens TaxID=6257 RepID=A0A915A939_PARUN